MKRVLIILILLLAVPCYGFDVEGRITRMSFKDDPYSSMKAGNRYEVRAKNTYAYLFASTETFRLYGKEDNRLNAAGLGFKAKIVDGLHAWGHAGYYMPDIDERGFPWEGLYFAQSQYLGPTYTPHVWDHYELILDPAFGGEIGFDLKKQIWKKVPLSVGATVSYRFLTLHEIINGYEANGNLAWQVLRNRDFGGWSAGFVAEWKF